VCRLRQVFIVPRFRSRQVSLPNTLLSCNYHTLGFMFVVAVLTAILCLTKEYGELVITWLQMLTLTISQVASEISVPNLASVTKFRRP
jgi:hypothetical protein